MNLSFNCSGKFLIREKSDYILRSGENSQLRKQEREKNLRPDEAPSSQMKLKNVYLGGLMDDSVEKLGRNRGESGTVGIFLNLNPGAFHEDEVNR